MELFLAGFVFVIFGLILQSLIYTFFGTAFGAAYTFLVYLPFFYFTFISGGWRRAVGNRLRNPGQLKG